MKIEVTLINTPISDRMWNKGDKAIVHKDYKGNKQIMVGGNFFDFDDRWEVKVEGRIKLVVVDECILGYIIPEIPKSVAVLHASILKGAIQYSGSAPGMIEPFSTFGRKIRLASEKDFEDYRCVFGAFGCDLEYEYQK